MIKIKSMIVGFFACVSILVSVSAVSEVSIIVNPKNSNELTGNQISRIFLGKMKSYPDGAEAIPVDQADSSPVYAAFIDNVLKKNSQQVKAYWAQLMFTGKGTPPRQVSSSPDVKKLVAENPALIGYIDSAEVDSSVKVVAKF